MNFHVTKIIVNDDDQII